MSCGKTTQNHTDIDKLIICIKKKKTWKIYILYILNYFKIIETYTNM